MRAFRTRWGRWRHVVPWGLAWLAWVLLRWFARWPQSRQLAVLTSVNRLLHRLGATNAAQTVDQVAGVYRTGPEDGALLNRMILESRSSQFRAIVMGALKNERRWWDA